MAVRLPSGTAPSLYRVNRGQEFGSRWEVVDQPGRSSSLGILSTLQMSAQRSADRSKQILKRPRETNRRLTTLICSASPNCSLIEAADSGCALSYNYALLFDAVRQSLHGKPSRSLRDLSQELHVSRGTLEKAVSVVTGKSFRCLRDEILVNHLINSFASRPACTIKQISLALGYKSSRSFARAIKRACGFSPVELRSRTHN